MKLTIIESIVVLYWYLIDIRAFHDYKYYLSVGVQAKYAFKKVFNNL